jgi:hypothetical protein
MKWDQEESVMDSKPRGLYTWQYGAEKEHHVAKYIQVIWQQAHALHLNKHSIQRILHKDLHYHPYKIQVAQELSEWDKWAKYSFAIFFDLVQNNSVILNTLHMSDEAHFHLYGYVNTQNCH